MVKQQPSELPSRLHQDRLYPELHSSQSPQSASLAVRLVHSVTSRPRSVHYRHSPIEAIMSSLRSAIHARSSPPAPSELYLRVVNILMEVIADPQGSFDLETG